VPTSAVRSVTPNMRSLVAQPPQASSLYARNAIRSLCRKMTATGCCTTGQTPDLQIPSSIDRPGRREAAAHRAPLLSLEFRLTVLELRSGFEFPRTDKFLFPRMSGILLQTSQGVWKDCRQWGLHNRSSYTERHGHHCQNETGRSDPSGFQS
jgi:hypothetical protein